MSKTLERRSRQLQLSHEPCLGRRFTTDLGGELRECIAVRDRSGALVLHVFRPGETVEEALLTWRPGTGAHWRVTGYGGLSHPHRDYRDAAADVARTLWGSP